MSLVNDLLEKAPHLSIASKYTAMNGLLYLATGALVMAWPGATQTLFRDAAFVGHEGALIRVVGLTVWSLAGFTSSADAPARDKSSPPRWLTD